MRSIFILSILFSFNYLFSQLSSDTIVCNGGAFTMVVNYNQQTCFGQCNGDYNVEVLNGSGTYEFSVVNMPSYSNNTPSDSSLCVGSYFIEVEDVGQGITCSTVFSIAELTNPTHTISAFDETEIGLCDGSAQIVINGGISPFTYQWYYDDLSPIPFQTSSQISGLCPGDYYVQYWGAFVPCSSSGGSTGGGSDSGGGSCDTIICDPDCTFSTAYVYCDSICDTISGTFVCDTICYNLVCNGLAAGAGSGSGAIGFSIGSPISPIVIFEQEVYYEYCPGHEDGFTILLIEGGTGNYEFFLGGGSVSPMFLGDNLYKIYGSGYLQVTDDEDNSASISLYTYNDLILFPTINFSDETCENSCDGTLIFDFGYDYEFLIETSIDGGNTWQASFNYQNLCPGNYNTFYRIENSYQTGYCGFGTGTFQINQGLSGSFGEDIITACESYTWIDGNTYFESNNSATHTLIGASANGCDSVVMLNLTLNSSIDSTFSSMASCNPTDTGTFIFNEINQLGCDSTHTLFVAFLPSDSTFEMESSCNPIDTGTYIFNETNQLGCDSTHTIFVTLLDSDSIFQTQNSCQPADTGVFIFNEINQLGCDSIFILIIELLESDSVLIDSVSCNPLDTGLFIFNEINQNGCDSIYMLDISFLPTDVDTLDISACDSAQINDIWFYNSINFDDTLVNANNCDSIIHYQIDITNSVEPLFSLETLICEDTSPFDLPEISDNGVEGSWNNTVNSQIIGTSAYVFTPTAGQCSDSIILNITVNSLEEPVFLNNDTICLQDNEFELLSVSQNGISGVWSPSLVLDESGSFEYTFVPDSNQCALSTNKVLFVQAPPIVEIDSFWQIELGDSLLLPIEVTGHAPFTFSWLAEYTSLSCDDCQSPLISPIQDELIILSVLDNQGCESLTNVMIEVLMASTEVLKIPNAFTPNGDNINDVFLIYGGEFNEISLIIYNRYGQKLFESYDVNVGWDGTFKGEKMHSGIYVYSFIGETNDGKVIKRMGNVSLIR